MSRLSNDATTPGKKSGAVELELVDTIDTVEVSHEQLMLEKKATRKTDLRLIPILGACYSISVIDRINISAARIAGMDAELSFNIGNRYSIALLVFFVTYFIFEISSNVVLRKVGAANWLSLLCFSWGVVIFGAGFAKDWKEIVMCRALLEFFEAGFFPGCVYLVSCWYTRYEVQKRLAVFYGISILANGFGSILAFGIMQLSGKAGYLGWRWIFIINGLMTVFLALLGRILIVDFPDKIKAVQDKLDRDRQDAEYDELTMRKFTKACGRWELWFFTFQFFSVTTIVYALAFIIPIILAGMGYTTKMVFLLAAPPAVAAVPWVLLISYLADRTPMRAPWIMMQSVLGIIGLMMIAYTKHNGVGYFGVFVGLAGANSNIPTCLAWQANNIRGQSLRMVASGLQVAFGTLGGIYASTTFMQKEAPLYRTGLWAVTFYMLISTGIMVWHYRRQNRRADRGDVVLEDMEGFRYTY
ncbi:major facilitator superfamily domain-containing protein [Clohesyomyces aquaticus]|uniref:Major facilitator superfamily domain-containing protein n=1 Tax=Clohesyomyces aquaticus TaxID=1231657 RepID=A0A1Y1YNG1_9PLEO|nr:major facilitator superfamily domain-containing protein [Clohesyomyces aquaticus]